MPLFSKFLTRPRNGSDKALSIRSRSSYRASSDTHTGASTAYDDRPYEGPSLNFPLQWLQHCLQNHSACSEILHSRYRPTRLIDLGRDFDFSKIHLIESESDDVPVEYLALSYCWGSTMPEAGKTYISTLSAHKTRIPRSKLPRTFKHFFEIAKRMGVRYVWIDALCIIQDSPSDWERETSEMGQIYANALLTIAAESAKDCRGGIWLESGFRIVNENQKQDITQEQNLRNYLASCDQRLAKSALQKRGWTMQERDLSPRVLHFTYAHMFWECKETKMDVPVLLGGCEEFIGSEAGRRSNSEDWAATRLRAFDISRPTQYAMPDLFYLWRTIVEEYSTRALTRATDRLPALSGLASQLEIVLNSEYMAGIWRNDIKGLLWVFKESGPYAQQARRLSEEEPSWSWSSYTVPITYSHVHEPFNNLQVQPPPSYMDAQVLGFDIIPAGLDPKGRCASGYIYLRGQVRWIISDQEFWSTRHTFFREDCSKYPEPAYSEMNPMLLIRILGGRGRGSFALALRPRKERFDEFKRIGVMCGIVDGWFDAGFDMTVAIA